MIKDLPFCESDSLIGDYFRAHPKVGEFSIMFRSTSRKSSFLNGDRFVYMKLNPNQMSLHPSAFELKLETMPVVSNILA